MRGPVRTLVPAAGGQVKCASVRGVRQHVNPFGLAYLEPRARAARYLARSTQPDRVEVELGCADADFSFGLAAAQPGWQVVGLDIREPVIERNSRRAERVGLANLEFAYCNLSTDLDRVFAANCVDRFHLLFPDPWIKPRHRKRRVLTQTLCGVLASQLRPGGELHVATDVFELALEMLAELEDPAAAALGFRNLTGPWRFAQEGPVPLASRREVITRRRGQRVWRMRYVVHKTALVTGTRRRSPDPAT
ncbi:MAG: methyltransferase domain-containing protein [Myxococcales bacterium FL481]|nr:MAG: methyltransferase domain-containing protein [Myxococcales bacterium FL481]